MDFNEAPNNVTIEAILNTIPLLTIAPTYDNVDRLLGIYNALYVVRDKLAQEGGETDAGDDSAK